MSASVIMLPSADQLAVKLRIAISPWLATPGIAVMTMLAAALAGLTGWLKVSVITLGALVLVPDAGVEAVIWTWASSAEGASAVRASARPSAAEKAGVRMGGVLC